MYIFFKLKKTNLLLGKIQVIRDRRGTGAQACDSGTVQNILKCLMDVSLIQVIVLFVFFLVLRCIAR